MMATLTPYQDGYKFGQNVYTNGKPRKYLGHAAEKACKQYGSPKMRTEFLKGCLEGYGFEEETDISIQDPKIETDYDREF